LRLITKAIIGLAILSGTGAVLVVFNIHGFLQKEAPVDAKILILETWFWDRPAIEEAAEEFHSGNYQLVICVGVSDIEDGQDMDRLLGARLQSLGILKPQLVFLRLPSDTQHRTFQSAVTSKEWLRSNHVAATSINVFTLGVHARKSWVAFKRVFGPGFQVGVLPGTEDAYDTRRWWGSKTGRYIVARNSLGYLYVRFWPLPKASGTS